MCSERVGRERRERGSPTIYQKNGVRGVERYRALLYWESLDASAQRKYGVGCVWPCLFSLRLYYRT